MSRLKIFLSILIIAVLSIVFIQNREPTTLRFLCGYGSSYCLFRSTELPLALWIALFTLNGIAINLLGQALNRYSYSGSKRQKYPANDELYSNETKWRDDATPSSNYTKLEDSTIKDKFRDATSYEVRQEPQNVERSGSTYSYKYKEAGDRTSDVRDNLRKKPVDPDVNSTISIEEDDEDWI